MDWAAVGVITGVVTAICALLAVFLRLHAAILEAKLEETIRRVSDLEQHGSRHAENVSTELGYLKSEVERFKRWQG